MWVPQKHLVYASAKIAHAIHKGNGRLIVSMPPRHGKSRLISETTIPWFLEKFPGRNVMLTSYNQDQAEEFGGKAKDLIEERGDLFGYSIRRDRSRVDRFETDSGSNVWFSGINGGQTGKGAHLYVIDDFIKDIEEALSPTHRQKVWLKFLANIYTRLEPGATVIIVATRWHSDDLIGRILSKLKGWEYICFPAIAEGVELEAGGVDALGRKLGDVLFPERYPRWRLDELKEAQHGTVIFEALFQQKPIDDATVFTDASWLKVAAIGPSDLGAMSCVRAWDFAATQGGGDFTTGTKMGRKSVLPYAFLLNVIRKQLSPAKIEELIRATAIADGIGCEVLLEEEPGSQSKSLIEHYKRNVLPEFKVTAVPAGNKSKLLKAQPMIAAAEAGNVFLCVDTAEATKGASPGWHDTFRREFGAFPPPVGGHDDQVDTASMCYNHLFQLNIISPVWGDSPDRSNYGLPTSMLAELGLLGQSSGSKQIVKGFTWGD